MAMQYKMIPATKLDILRGYCWFKMSSGQQPVGRLRVSRSSIQYLSGIIHNYRNVQDNDTSMRLWRGQCEAAA